MSSGTGWADIDTGVSAFGFTNLNGVNGIVDVRWDGTLLTWSGAGWTIRGSGVASFDVGMGFVWLIGSKGISYLYNF